MNNGNPSAPRCAALVGPYLGGKTTLLESLLFTTGAIGRKGSIKDGNTVGDSSAEAKARQMSVEVSLASTGYLGERWSFLDCPGSIELAAEAQNALMVADVAVVVCEPVPEKALTLAPLFKFLDDNQIPHMVFINKMDLMSVATDVRVRDVLQALQAVSARPLVLRQVPIRDGEAVTGYVDLVSERAYHYRPGEASDLVQVPETVREREATARQEMLEALADFDDSLLEQLLEDVVPDRREIYKQLCRDLSNDTIVPVFLGSAERDHGVRRLLKALRHETPEAVQTAARLGLPENVRTVAQVFKTYHAPHAGKLSFARIWRGTVADNATLGGERVSGLYRMTGLTQDKLSTAGTGEVVGFGRMEGVCTGDVLTEHGAPLPAPFWPDPRQPVYALAIVAENRNDEVKLTGALAKLIEEDPSLSLQQAGLGEMVLCGQGDIHLQIAFDRLRNKYNIAVRGRPPQVPYRETIRKSTSQHARFKRQTGGHGQFADVKVEIRPLERGAGFEFAETVVGGAVPRQFIPAVETGVRDYLSCGPLGFPVVDIAVTLTDGQFHAVDSSEQAFKTAGRMAMAEGLPKCDPVLLEPIMLVTISTPGEATAKIQRLVTGRRGQILGFDSKPGWPGWDEVKAYMPQSDIHDLIIELRSLTLGVGSFVAAFDHLAELTGRLAERAIEIRQSSAAAQ